MRVPLLVLVLANLACAVWILGRADGSALGALATGAASTEPVRVVPCSVAAADFLADLVEPARVAALPEQVRKWSKMNDAPEVWGDHPLFDRVKAESVLAQGPDLVLASPQTDRAALARIREAGVRVVLVPEPTTWPGVLAAGRVVAEATATGGRWDELVADLERRRAALLSRAPATPPRVLPFGNYNTESYTAGAGTTLDLALSLAGCSNHAAALGIQGPASISAEELLTAPFDWFLVSGDSVDNTSTQALLSSDRLAALPPVRDRRFLVLPPPLYSSASHTILDAAERIAAALGAR